VDIHELSVELNKGVFAPVYQLCGEEGAWVERALELVLTAAQQKGQMGAHSLVRLEGKGASAHEIEVLVRTCSLFGGRKFVVLQDAHAMRADEAKKLHAYLHKPVASSTLVLVSRGLGPTSREAKSAVANLKAFQTAVKKGGGVFVDCPKIKARDVPSLIRSLLKQQGLSADPQGAHALAEAIGEDVGGMFQAVEKLSIYLGGQGQVTARDVAEVVASSRTLSVFELNDAVGERSPERALMVLDTMIRDGENALGILAQLTRHVSNLASVQALAKRGQSQEEIKVQLGLHPFVVKKTLEQCRNHRPASLSRSLALFHEADVQIKRGKLPERLVLERLVMGLCQG